MELCIIYLTLCKIIFSTQEEGLADEFVLLPFPPLYDPEASKQQEHQRVLVDFKTPDEEPDAHRYIVNRDQIGSLELLSSFQPDQEQKARLMRRIMLGGVHVYASLFGE